MTQKQQINSRALEMVQGLEDKERLVYEIASSMGNSNIVSEWPNKKISLLGGSKDCFIYNSEEKFIATFRRKK